MDKGISFHGKLIVWIASCYGHKSLPMTSHWLHVRRFQFPASCAVWRAFRIVDFRKSMESVEQVSAAQLSLINLATINAFSSLALNFFNMLYKSLALCLSLCCRRHNYNISGILNGLQVGYDKRVRPNYGGECRVLLAISRFCLFSIKHLWCMHCGKEKYDKFQLK